MYSISKRFKTVAFLKHLFEREAMAHKAAVIVEAILAARSPRRSDIAQHMPRQAAANYKAIQRFLAQADPQVGARGHVPLLFILLKQKVILYLRRCAVSFIRCRAPSSSSSSHLSELMSESIRRTH